MSLEKSPLSGKIKYVEGALRIYAKSYGLKLHGDDGMYALRHDRMDGVCFTLTGFSRQTGERVYCAITFDEQALNQSASKLGKLLSWEVSRAAKTIWEYGGPKANRRIWLEPETAESEDKIETNELGEVAP